MKDELITSMKGLETADTALSTADVVEESNSEAEDEKSEHRSLKELKAIYRTCEQLQWLGSPESLTKEITRVLRETLGYKYGAIMLINEATGRLTPFMHFDPSYTHHDPNLKENFVSSCNYRLCAGITGWVAETGESVRVGDVEKDSRYHRCRPYTRSELCVPMQINHEVIGVINIESQELNSFTEQDQLLLESLAVPIAIALQNTRLYSQLRTALVEYKLSEDALRESEEFNSSLLNSSPCPISIFEQDTSVRYVNPAFEELTMFTLSKIQGAKAPYPWWSKEKAQMKPRECEQAFYTRPRLTEEIFQAKDGREFWVKITTTPVKQKGKVKYYLSCWVDITERKSTEQKLRDRQIELQIKNKNLQKFNTALTVLLQKREQDRRDLEESVLHNVKKLVLPYMNKLRQKGISKNQNASLAILESRLREVTSPFARNVSSSYFNFTPAEIQVADFIKHGKSTKEIAEFLNLSCETIVTHRKNIRKKIGIYNKKANLRTHLLALD